jgi:hypothetical protein
MGDRSPAIAKITQHIPSKITQEHNEALMRPITIEEVYLVLEDTTEGKAPSSDDFTTDFFHHFGPW